MILVVIWPLILLVHTCDDISDTNGAGAAFPVLGRPVNITFWKLKTGFEVAETVPDQDQDGLLGQVDLRAGAEEEGGQCAGGGAGQLGYLLCGHTALGCIDNTNAKRVVTRYQVQNYNKQN